jgi:phosphoribosylamine--glycine ligase
MKVLLIGNGAREHAIAETLKKNKKTVLFSYMKSKNPGIVSFSKGYETGNYDDLGKIGNFAKNL